MEQDAHIMSFLNEKLKEIGRMIKSTANHNILNLYRLRQHYINRRDKKSWENQVEADGEVTLYETSLGYNPFKG